MSGTLPAAARRRRVGVLGGSFDPVHNAHLALARRSLDDLALDQLLWVPTGEPWQKSRVPSPAVHRLAMLQLALASEPRYLVSRLEIDRPGPSYSIDTVQSLRAADPDAELVLLIGADQYARLHTWHRWAELLSCVTLAVAARPGAALTEADPAVRAVPCEVVALPPMAISSTEVRARIRHGRPVDDLVPIAVARYIAQHRLYGDKNPAQELNGHS